VDESCRETHVWMTDGQICASVMEGVLDTISSMFREICDEG